MPAEVNTSRFKSTLTVAATIHPLDEAVQARLIRAYHVSGQQSLAFERYEQVRRALAEKLGVDPGLELAAAHRWLLEQAARPPAMRTPRQLPIPGSLPIYAHALEAARDLDDTQAEAHLRTNLGAVYRVLGR